VIVIVCPLLLVNELVVASVNAAPPFLPVQVGFAASVHTAPLAVKTTVFESVVIAVVVVAFSTIFDGVRLIDVSSTSPSIAVIAVTELYVAATLGITSVLETPVMEIAVTAAGCAANSEVVLHVKTIAAWVTPDVADATVNVIWSLEFKPPPLLDTAEVVSVAALLPLIAHVAVAPAHGVAPVCVNVIVVGARTVLVSGVHVYTIETGFVPSAPTVETCVTAMASAPCCAAVVT
jgi:hypothetical protein